MTAMLSNPERVALLAIADVLEPPPPVDYLAWAKANIVFSDRESSFPGPYNEEMFPYFSEVLKALGPDDPSREVTFMKSAQLGGTVLANIFVLGSMAMDPCDFLFVHPTEENGRRWSRMKLAPMLRNTTCLTKHFPPKSRDTSDTLMYKERADGRGAIQISGANSPASLSQVTMRRQVQDDLSKWEMNLAGDPEKQANSRSRGRADAKIFKISTPLIEPGCKITKNFKSGTQEYLHVPCPHCGHMHKLEWENFLSNLDEDHPEKAHFSCPDCGGVIEEYHIPEMRRQGVWIAENPKARNRSFYIWSAYSALQSFVLIATEWLSAKGDPASEQVFMNDTVGLAYRTKGESVPWEILRARAEETGHLRGQIPPGAIFLTLGIDCQKDRVEWQLVGCGRDGRRYVIDCGVITGHIADQPARDGLNELLKQTWRNSVGRDIAIDLAAIDGNAWTEDVWDWAKKHPVSKVIMVRGANRDSAPLLKLVKKDHNPKTGKLLRYSKRFYNFNASVLKMALYRNTAKTDPMARGYIGFAKGLEDEYFHQFTSERRVPVKRRDGFTAYRWEKDSGQANEMLDTMLQAEAAAIKLGLRTLPPSVWDRYEAERETPPPEPQMDFEELPLGGAPAPAASPVVKNRRVRSRGI